MSTRSSVKIEGVRHVRICGGRDLYCAHPRQGALYNFGGGEIALIHSHATWPYAERRPVHGFGEGYKSRSVSLLNRSTDGGETWPEENNVVVFDETLPVEDRRELLCPDSAEREHIDLTAPDSIVFFSRTWLGDLKDSDEKTEEPTEAGKVSPGKCLPVCFALRSPDRGWTWEKVPTVVIRSPWHKWTLILYPSPIEMPDGTFVTPASVLSTHTAEVYGTDDDGLTWEYLAEVVRTSTPTGGISYPALIRLPDGRLQCYMLEMFGKTHAICVSESRDVYNWTPLRPIIRWGASPWRARLAPGEHSPPDSFPGQVFYRSPWPLLLRDGRILVVFARRKPPYGIGGILSEDEGKTWSNEFIIRHDASGTDIGYPVTTQLEDGRVFSAYYFMLEDGNPHGGSRFIAGSLFKV